MKVAAVGLNYVGTDGLRGTSKEVEIYARKPEAQPLWPSP